ncbi:MAG: hypothetical protein WD989_01365 [Candidatus Paceibacterota bacterium]
MTAFVKKYAWTLAIAGFIIVNMFLVLSFLETGSGPARADLAAVKEDLEDFKSKNLKSFKDLSEYFSGLAEAKGAVYAYELLKIAPVPPNTDMHLLGHVVGDLLYRQEGVKGIYKCTQDFRNACSHTIVVGLFFEKGEAALEEMADICRKAPGSGGAYTMCFHGLGHGILAYNDYNLEKTVAMCSKVGTSQYQNREIGECIGGSIMEIIGGGFHDQEAWKRERQKYLKKEQPLYPCNSDLIIEEGRHLCYSYLTPHLFVSAGADLGNPSPLNFEKAFTFCDKLPAHNTQDRLACFAGFGKEFVALVKSRDIRKINELSDDEMKKIHLWCSLAKVGDGTTHCLMGAMASIFWGGENDPKVSIRYCLLLDESRQDACFNVLVSEAFRNMGPQWTRSLCLDFPDKHKSKCPK